MNFANLAYFQAIGFVHGPTRSENTRYLVMSDERITHVFLFKAFFTKHSILLIMLPAKSEHGGQQALAVLIPSFHALR